MNQSKTYYALQNKCHEEYKDKEILYRTRALARQAKKEILNYYDYSVIKVNIKIKWN